MDFYGEISIQSNSGERYLFPAVLERKTVEDANASLRTTVAELRHNAKAVDVVYGPVLINEVFGPHVKFRIKNRLGHVRAGMLKIYELELTEALEHDGELSFKVDDEGRFLMALKNRSYPLFRLLAN